MCLMVTSWRESKSSKYPAGHSAADEHIEVGLAHSEDAGTWQKECVTIALRLDNACPARGR
jgi:hypothetical protein